MEARASEVLVGRGRELEELQEALEAVRNGAGRTVLLAGEAGIGKTRLASELEWRAGEAGLEVLVGRSIDLVGTELPYQPVVEALRLLGDPRHRDAEKAGSQLQVFEEVLALLTEHAAAEPVLLVLEDLHWADTSTLDLVVFLAHNLDDRRALLLGTYRPDEPSSAARMSRLAEGVRRSRSALVLELGPLDDADLRTLVTAQVDAPPTPTLVDAIVARAEGNPFFAEELLSAAGDGAGELPHGLRDLLLQRVARLERATQGVLRLAAAAGREVPYSLLRETAALPESELRELLRQAVEHGVLVAEQMSGSFRFRHALLAEAVYATILPGEREELHETLAVELASSGDARSAELAPHWAAAGRPREALAASVQAARDTEAVFGLAESFAHLERALGFWEYVPDAAELAQLDLAELCSWAADLASRTGGAPRAVELAQRAIDLVHESDLQRTAQLYDALARYLHESGKTDAALTAVKRMVELVPAEPPSAERAEALAALARGLMLAWRFDESLGICEEALALARATDASAVERRSLPDFGRNLAYVGRTEEGVRTLRRALELAENTGDPVALLQACVSLTDVLTMLGRPREAARLAEQGLDSLRPYGIDATVLVANWIEALLAIGEWENADSASAAALRSITANFPYMLLMLRADLEIGRGEFGGARAYLEAALGTLREDRGQGIYDVFGAELALWERRWTDAEQAVRDALARAGSRRSAQLRVWFCAKGLRAHAELAALARARRDSDAVHTWLARARELVTVARRAADEASPVTPNAAGWLALAEAEYGRARGESSANAWSETAGNWDALERPPLAAYCRWRQAEALVAVGASRAEAAPPLREAHAVAAGMGARPLLEEVRLLAQRARVDLTAPDADARDGTQELGETLGLTPREGEVLSLVARGFTNREIAAALVISVKTASVHVSHILRKLGAPDRREAAAIAHRLAPGRPELGA
jgi:DNA-binding CsgD family transcriptional regulator/tetratricopeptide (TPR) repeat protein